MYLPFDISKDPSVRMYADKYERCSICIHSMAGCCGWGMIGFVQRSVAVLVDVNTVTASGARSAGAGTITI